MLLFYKNHDICPNTLCEEKAMRVIHAVSPQLMKDFANDALDEACVLAAVVKVGACKSDLKADLKAWYKSAPHLR
jgi:hypothetical protein